MASKLVEYGILTEESDYRVHVCFGEGYIYRYGTKCGVEACRSGKFKQRMARQPNFPHPTAMGNLVPPDEIETCLRIQIPQELLMNVSCRKEEDTSAKGSKAVEVVRRMLLGGFIPIEVSPRIIRERDIQIKGLDIEVEGRATIQVKCDYDGGKLGTGYLFLQTEERNPFGKY